MSTSSAITERHARRAYRLKCTGKGQVQVLDIIFFERVVNVWNSLPNEVDFSTVKRFTRTIKRVPFNDLVSC